MIDQSFLDQLTRFSIIVTKHVTSHYSGMRRSVSAGQGLVFEDHQPYAYGDDFRRIDWKVYARSDHLFVRRFEEEKSLTVRMLLDASASMSFRRKWDYASMVAVGLGYLTMRENEKFQFFTFDELLVAHRAKRGREHLGQMINTLNSMRTTHKGELLKNIRLLKKQISSRSLVFVISDFLYDLEEVRTSLTLLKKNEVHLIQVLDEQELEFAYTGEYTFKDAESPNRFRTFVSPGMRSAYLGGLTDHLMHVESLAKDTGAKYTLVSTKDTVFDAFHKILS